mgnify:CR=1 FL=1
MKYYLTYYEEYPIYEPAEGGYYYAGCSAEEWAYDEDLSEVLKYIPEYLEKHDMEFRIARENIVPIFEQYVLAELINSGDFERQINRIRRNRRKEQAQSKKSGHIK